MKPSKCVLLITGCIFPKKEIPVLQLKDSVIRKEQYIKSIMYYVDCSNFEKIVYCDNSNAVADKKLIEYAFRKGKNLEWISFQGNSSMAIKQGKGFGEGEIIDYALKHSELLKNANYICKITGRLIVENVNVFLRIAKNKYSYFQPASIADKKPYISTKIYFMPLKDYNEFFRNAYQSVDDRNGFYLEHSFGKIVKNNNYKYKVFIIFPDYKGMSGSTGKNYKLKKRELIKQTIKMYRAKI